MGSLNLRSGIQVIDLDLEVDLQEINKSVEYYLGEISHRTNIDDFGSLKVTFFVLYISSDKIGVFKRARTYQSSDEKEFTVSIPIPSIGQSKFGISEKHFYEFLPITEEKAKNFIVLEPNFDKYNSLIEYTTDAIKRAIDEALRFGLTVNGKKLKYK